MRQQHRYQMAGFSLLEVMIAAVVLSFGLLGLVALQMQAKVASYEARQRTIASWLANDMVERVRINRDSWSATGATLVDLSTPQVRPSCAASDGYLSGCNRGDLRAADLYYWQQAMLGASVSGSVASLQSPVGCIVRRANNVLDVAIFWSGKQSVTDASTANMVATLRNDCAIDSTVNKARRQFTLTTTL
ncbi:type IV pilus modification protein PilV [Aeromonas caviae]|uniref:type IV pilus modification protein PilV n=1 Tax=Aeromonas caviae TaxID=648 RepID=UPI0015E4E723|nr:type IV pilus modification protein PilV [Aeromonas caviae]QLL83377.1 type IV pilus modification protein PilV [Aeromonas caviae]